MQSLSLDRAIPGVTPIRTSYRAPKKDADGKVIPRSTLARALDETDPKLLATKLEEVARDWFDSHAWYYEEVVTCLANYYGAQWGYYSEIEQAYIATPEPRSAGQIRIVVNAIKPVADQAVALMTQEEPLFSVAAASSEANDSAAQQAGDSILRYEWREAGLTELYRIAARLAYIGGTAIVHECWDPSEGPISEAADGQSDIALDGEGNVIPRTMRSGDTRYTLLMPDQVAPDPACRTEHDGAGVFVREVYTRDALEHRFPERHADVKDSIYSGDIARDGDLNESRMATRSSPISASVFRMDDADRETVTLYTFYGPSCAKYPRGVMICFGDGAVVYDSRTVSEYDNPIYPAQGEQSALWPRRKSPLFRIVCDPRENCWWGRGRVVDMIEPQRAFNGVISKALEHIATIANTKVRLPSGLNIDWTDEIGQVIRVPRNINAAEIGYLQPPSLSPEYWSMWDRLKGELELIGGVNSTTMGASAPNVESGRHANLLMQRDYGRLAPVKRAMDNVWGEAMRYTLLLYQRHADEPRKLLIVGENGRTSVKSFDKSSFGTSIDVLVQNDQSVPRDPQQKALFLSQFAQTLANTPDPGIRNMLIELHRLKDFEPFLERMSPDQVKARRMCWRLLAGEPTTIFEGDDALVFVEEINRLFKSEEFEAKVEQERAQFGGVSPTEEVVRMHWLYYMQMASGGGAAPMGPGGGMPAPPMANSPVPGDEEKLSEAPPPKPEQQMAA